MNGWEEQKELVQNAGIDFWVELLALVAAAAGGEKDRKATERIITTRMNFTVGQMNSNTRDNKRRDA